MNAKREDLAMGSSSDKIRANPGRYICACHAYCISLAMSLSGKFMTLTKRLALNGLSGTERNPVVSLNLDFFCVMIHCH